MPITGHSLVEKGVLMSKLFSDSQRLLNEAESLSKGIDLNPTPIALTKSSQKKKPRVTAAVGGDNLFEMSSKLLSEAATLEPLPKMSKKESKHLAEQE